MKINFSVFLQLRDKIIDNYEKRKTRPDYGALCDEDIKILKKWNYNPNITDDNDQLLTAEVIYVSFKL